MSKSSVEIIQLEPLLCSAKQAAALCGGISVRTWWSMVATGQAPPSIRLRGRRLWDLKSLRRWTELGCPTLDRFLALQKESKRETSKNEKRPSARRTSRLPHAAIL